jgi:class 3 adenylate cyclase/pimeloyl-ACP methyl ester carboxylesterase
VAAGPRVEYVAIDDGYVAWQRIGGGERTVLFLPGAWTNLEADWDYQPNHTFLRRLGELGCVLRFDRRSTGLSDPLPGDRRPALEDWVEDAVAVLDAAGVDDVVVYAHDLGVACAIAMATAHASRVRALILHDGFARWRRAPDYAAGMPDHLVEQVLASDPRSWGAEDSIEVVGPSAVGNESLQRAIGRYQRLAAGLGTRRRALRFATDVDVRTLLPLVSAPTLVLTRAGNAWVRPAHGEYLAANIAGAVLRALPGVDHHHFLGFEAALEAIEEFLEGRRLPRDADRTLATVVITDVVGSTALAAAGDDRWRDRLDEHDAVVAAVVERFAGRVVKHTGDGVVVLVDGPARAIRCASDLRDEVAALGLPSRTGIHTGEIERRGDDVAGVAVHIAARVSALAAPGEILVSRTVKDLVAGSGIAFTSAGTHSLKGVDEPWDLYAVV